MLHSIAGYKIYHNFPEGSDQQGFKYGGNCYLRIPEYFERPEHIEFEKRDRATQARLMRNASRQVKRNKGLEGSSDEEEPEELSDR